MKALPKAASACCPSWRDRWLGVWASALVFSPLVPLFSHHQRAPCPHPPWPPQGTGVEQSGWEASENLDRWAGDSEGTLPSGLSPASLPRPFFFPSSPCLASCLTSSLLHLFLPSLWSL